MGVSLHPTGRRWDNATRNGVSSVWARLPRSASMGAMRGNPFLNFQRAAEDAGYPALLIVSALCLGLVVAPIALLGLTQAIWVLGLALLSLIAAVAVLAGAMDAAFSDYGEPVGEPQKLDVAAPGERDPAAPLPRRLPANRQAGQDRRAA
jgi:hypothetical protein